MLIEKGSNTQLQNFKGMQNGKKEKGREEEGGEGDEVLIV
jgi:hypothetical protein